MHGVISLPDATSYDKSFYCIYKYYLSINLLPLKHPSGKRQTKYFIIITHLSRMEYPPLINWKLNGKIYKQTLETLIRRRIMQRLIRVSTVCLCLCPTRLILVKACPSIIWRFIFYSVSQRSTAKLHKESLWNVYCYWT